MKEQILDVLDAQKDDLGRRFSVASIGLFGSYASGNAGPESDIDILVEFNEESFDNYMDLKFHLENVFHTRVDLVLSGCLKERIRNSVMDGTLYA